MGLVIGGALVVVALLALHFSFSELESSEHRVTRRPESLGSLAERGVHEVGGTLACSVPLVPPGYDRPCVYYRVEVGEPTGGRLVPDVEVDGRSRCVERCVEEAVPFDLEDEKASVAVDPTGADVHAPLLREGRADTVPAPLREAVRAQGDESVRLYGLPVGATAYVFGEVVRRDDGGLWMGPDDGPFIISDEPRLSGAVHHVWWRNVALLVGLGSLAAGLTLVVTSF